MYCKCGNQIPQVRNELGYSTCIECSSETRYSALAVNYHKTGNTVQVIKDPKTAARAQAMSQRTGFGILKSMRSSKKRVVKNTKSNTPSKETEINHNKLPFAKEGRERLRKYRNKVKPSFDNFIKFRNICIRELQQYGADMAFKKSKYLYQQQLISMKQYMDINNIIKQIK